MGPRERREREREETRTRILDAARELFAAEGYEAVTMRRIAERIEYSATAIYFHFKDKEALVKELCDVDFTSFAPNRSFISFAHRRLAARNFATSSIKSLCTLKKKESRGANSSTGNPRSTAAFT